MIPMEGLEIAEKWTHALDHDLFDGLAGMMAADCLYRSPGGVLIGPLAIVDSYRSSSEWAHETFDSITWASEYEPDEEDHVLITFSDITEHRGVHHTYRCRQRIRIGEDGLIHEIQHLPIAAEETALAEFFSAVGVKRSGR